MFDDRTDDPEDVVHQEMNRLRGRLCGLIESWGLPDRQERGAVATLKSLTYDSEAVLVDLLSEPNDDIPRHINGG